MPKANDDKHLLVGAAQVDITPRMGTQIAGDIGRRRPAELVIDPLYAHALVVQSGGRKLCIVSLDLCTIVEKYVHMLRQMAAEQFGFDEQAVLIHVVQNHAAPSFGHAFVSEQCKPFPPEHPWLYGGDDAYHEFVVPKIVEAIGRACQAMQPARYGLASGVETRVAFNRRFILRDGTAVTHGQWRNIRDLLQIEGPVDPEVGVLAFSTEQLKIVAAILHHTCHPVHGYPERYITAGWPGAWAAGVRQAVGEQCVPVVLNGCCGNIHHSNHLDPTHDDSFPTIGRRLTDDTRDILKKIRWRSDAPALDWRTRTVQIPMRQLPQEQIEAARKLVSEHPQPIWIKNAEGQAVEWDWVYAVCQLDMAETYKRRPIYDMEVQVLRIGDYAIVGVPGEPFVEGQLEIKRHSPAKRTFVAHFSTGYSGYIPTREALQRGGFETRPANWSKLAPEALEIMSRTAVSLLNEMFAT